MESAEKRTAVMQAALEMVGERGFHGSPMALIAEKAGVAAGTIYRFFESKDALIKEIYSSLEGEVLAAVTSGYPGDGPVRERFLHIGTRVVSYFIASPLEFRFVEQFHNSPYGVACRREQFFERRNKNLISELLEEARGQGIVKDLPLPVLLALTFGPLVDVCRDQILGFITLDDRLLERTLAACWDAVRQEPPADRRRGGGTP